MHEHYLRQEVRALFQQPVESPLHQFVRADQLSKAPRGHIRWKQNGNGFHQTQGELDDLDFFDQQPDIDRDHVNGKTEQSYDEKPSTDEIMAGGGASLYLQEIARAPLLTAEQEIHLAKKLEKGLEAQQELDSNDTNLTAERKAALKDAIEEGKAARIRMVESNLRLVVSVARKYLGRGLPFLDLVQEGNIGLQRGVGKYDWRRGFRFSTYAYWWIRQSVSRAIAKQSRTIRVPVHVFEQLGKLYSTIRVLELEFGREPTDEEIGAKLGIDAPQVEELRRIARTPISLDTAAGDDPGYGAIADSLADETEDIEAAGENHIFSAQLEEALHERLTRREADVLRLRYGLGGHDPKTLGEIGKDLGISRERARQLEAAAMIKLRRDVGFRRELQDAIE